MKFRYLYLILFLFWAPVSYAATLTVCASGCDQTTIGAAITAATAGDTVSVGTGTYNENLSVSKNLTITDTGDGTVTVDAQDSGYPIQVTGGPTVTLENITFANPESQANGAAIYVNGSTVTIDGCTATISTNPAWDLKGIYLIDSTATVQNTTVSLNDPGGTGSAVFLDNSTLTMEDSEINDSLGRYPYGIRTDTSSGNSTITLTNTLIEGYENYGVYAGLSGDIANISYVTLDGGGDALYGVRADNGTTATINSAIISNHATACTTGTGTFTNKFTNCYSPNSSSGVGNIASDPLYTDYAGNDFTLQSSSPGIDTGDPHTLDADEGRSDMGYTGGKGAANTYMYVGTGWFSAIADAEEAYETGDTIQVAAGTYTENVTLGSSSNTDITFEGGYNSDFSSRDVSANETIISGYIQGDGDYAGTFTVDGFTITSSGSSAIYTQNTSADVTVNNCKLHSNTTQGIYLYGVDTAIITNNTIYSNGTGSGIYDYGIYVSTHTSVAISGNTIYSNPDGGILIDNTVSADTISSNTVYSNTSNGIKMNIYTTSYTPTISSNTVYSNSGDGINILGGSPSITNNIVYSNTGDGIYISATNAAQAPVVNNNTVAKNGDDGIDIYQDGVPTIKNNILYQNTWRGIYLSTSFSGSDAVPVSISYNSFYDNGNAELTHSGQSPYSYHNDTPDDYYDMNSPSWASGNCYLDPGFTDQANDDYTLASTSYLIDKGDSSDSYANEPEDNGDRINIGAYGNTSSAVTKPATPTVSSVTALQSGSTVTIGFDSSTTTDTYDITAEYWDGSAYQTFTPDSGLSDASRITAGTGQSLTWDGSEISGSEYAAGKIRITATRGNSDSGSGESAEFVLDYKEPTTSISAPSTGTLYSSTPPSFTASASDSGSGVASVKFQYKLSTDGSYTDLNTDTSSTYEASWGAVSFTTGSTYNLQVLATDSLENSTTSSQVDVTIGQPTVDFTSSAYSSSEDAGASTVTVELSGTSSDTITVDYTSINGTATAGSDYTAVSGTLTFSAGETSKTFTLTPTDDSGDDDSETITLTLSNAVNATLGSSNNPSTFTITDNDGVPTVDFSASTFSGTESGGAITVTVALSNSSNDAITVDYTSSDSTATAGTDYTAVSGTLTFNAGETSKTFTITPTDDSLDEDDETISVTLSNPTVVSLANIYNPATVTVTDDDNPPTVDFSTNSYSGTESGGDITVTVNLSAASSKTITIDYASSNSTATAGTDYTAVSGTLTFSAGDTSKTFTITPIDDFIDEDDEIISVTLSNPTVGSLANIYNPATVTITDDDAAPTMDFSASSYSGAEEDGDVTVTVNLSAVSGKTITVDYASSNGTAIAGSDYIAVSGTLSFSPGEITKTFTVTPLLDQINEGSETVSLTLSNASNSSLSNTNNPATLTIINTFYIPSLNTYGLIILLSLLILTSLYRIRGQV